jgi:hypothetical protein
MNKLPEKPILIRTGNLFFFRIFILHNVRWVPCHHGMGRPQVADGGYVLQVWTVAANILNKQSRTADNGWSSSLGVGRAANNSSQYKISLLRNATKSLGTCTHSFSK